MLNVIGTINVRFKLGGYLFSDVFQIQVIDNLSQDVILGSRFMEHTGALLDYRHKCLLLYNGTVIAPFRMATNHSRAVCTLKGH